MEQTSLLPFPQSSDSSIDMCCFDNVADAPGDSVVLTTAEVGSLTEIAADGDFVICKSASLG